jgi:hypothetical protein
MTTSKIASQGHDDNAKMDQIFALQGIFVIFHKDTS